MGAGVVETVVITLFCVRPKGFNIGNDTIFLGLRRLVRRWFDDRVNIVQVPAVHGEPGHTLRGLSARSIHQMNLLGHGVIVGGGNVYENGALDVDVNALAALRLPLMLFSLSHGRIYDHAARLVRRTDAMPDSVIRALHERAAISLVRDEATLEYVGGLGIADAVLGGCPSMFLADEIAAATPPPRSGALVSIRHPDLTSLPVASCARLQTVVRDLLETLDRDGFGPVRILCHDIRDLPFAASFDGFDYILSDDVHGYLDTLRAARLVVTFRLHAFLPCTTMGIPAINISYDERSSSLVRTVGFGAWDIDFMRCPDVVSAVRDRTARLAEFEHLRAEAAPRWHQLITTMDQAMGRFARLATEYSEASTR